VGKYPSGISIKTDPIVDIPLQKSNVSPNNNNNNIILMMMIIIIIGTAHKIRKMLQSETGRLRGRVYHWLKRRAARKYKTCDKRTTRPAIRKQKHNN
jgi:hypothetical protein